MSILIEKNIPLPGNHKYPWDKMNVGDSFFVPTENGKSESQHVQNVSGAAHKAAKKNGWKMTTRKVAGGARVWRLA
jgi:hypothetical protein